MEIRPVRPEDDRLAISRVYEESWKVAYAGLIPRDYLDALPPGRWAGVPDAPGLHSLVALEGGQIVGTCCYCAARLDGMEGWGELVSLYLLPPFWGRGIGRALLLAAEADLRAMGFDALYLWVLEGNRRARRFYERMGFLPAGPYLDDEIGGARLREVQYRREGGLTAAPDLSPP